MSRERGDKYFVKTRESTLYPDNIFAVMQYLYYTRDIFFDKLPIYRANEGVVYKPRFIETPARLRGESSPFLSFFRSLVYAAFPNSFIREEKPSGPLIRDDRPIVGNQKVDSSPDRAQLFSLGKSLTCCLFLSFVSAPKVHRCRC